MKRADPPASRLRALLLAASALALFATSGCEDAVAPDSNRSPVADWLPSLSIADSGATEGTGSVLFRVTLSRASSKTVTVRYATADGSATAGADYAAVADGVLTFMPGEREESITVMIVADGLDEPSVETFTVTLSGPRHARLGDASATGTIRDDDLTVAATADAVTVVEGDAATFTVTVTGGPSATPVEVGYEVAGTAVAGEDYEPPSGLLPLVAGAATGTITVRTMTDEVLDPGETLKLRLLPGRTTPAGMVTVNPAPAATTILDVGMVTVAVDAETKKVTEGEDARFAVTMTGAVASPVTLGWGTADAGATAGEDFVAVTDGVLTFSPGAGLRQVVAVKTLDDDLDEPDETLAVVLTGVTLPPGVTLGAARDEVTIVDDDPPAGGSGDDHGDTPATATRIAPGVVISGQLESAEDVDYFRLTASSTGTLVAATDAGKVDHLPTVVGIDAPDGDSISGEHYAEFAPAPPGVYYVRVAGATATRYDLAVLLFDPLQADLSFDIELRFLGTQPTPAQARTIRAAADSWERVITRGLPPMNILTSEVWCEPGDPSLFGVHVDDLLINVRLDYIGPGEVLALAGPCAVRAESHLPYFGDVLFDTADIRDLEQSGVLYDTALHEIAHVLGFGLGALWDGMLREPSAVGVSGQDTHFNGAAAVAAFDRAGGASYAGEKVPVENDTTRFGRGALDTHWRESVFGEELMTTAVVIEDGSEPLSEVTIAALEDLGYQVDYRRAQRYRLPPATSLRQPARVIHLYHDVRQGPIRVD